MCFWRIVLVAALWLVADTRADAQAPNAVREADVAGLRATIALLGKESRGTLGVGIELLETRQRVVVGAHHHPMQSVYKLPIAMAVLDLVDRGTLRLDQMIDIPTSMYVTPGQLSPIRDKYPNGARLALREILQLNTAVSDGTACDVLLKLIGGPEKATAYFRRIGVAEMVAATTELEIGKDRRAQYRSWSTPVGALTLLRAVHERRVLSDSSHALLMRYLTETTTGPNRLRGDLPAGTVVAHKTGSSGTSNGVAAATNDIGIITMPNGQHLAVAVFLTDSRADDATRDRVIARVARAAWETWVSPTVRPTAR
ncbi:MAG TPA: class A beta-lactamase [Gemmatimonadaceae bacterium]|nr:class A beta-lactamase [Gemmatimonadaceae bacterium]